MLDIVNELLHRGALTSSDSITPREPAFSAAAKAVPNLELSNFVHVGRTDGPVLITLEKELVDFALVSDIDFRDILNVDTLALELVLIE